MSRFFNYTESNLVLIFPIMLIIYVNSHWDHEILQKKRIISVHGF